MGPPELRLTASLSSRLRSCFGPEAGGRGGSGSLGGASGLPGFGGGGSDSRGKSTVLRMENLLFVMSAGGSCGTDWGVSRRPRVTVFQGTGVELDGIETGALAQSRLPVVEGICSGIVSSSSEVVEVAILGPQETSGSEDPALGGEWISSGRRESRKVSSALIW